MTTSAKALASALILSIVLAPPLALARTPIATGTGGAVATISEKASESAIAILNTGGNAGGLIGIPIVAWLSGQGHWQASFLIGFACALAAALAWLWVDADEPLVLR